MNGVLTSDPRLVTGASTISEISCHEAAELARFGAKVLHPKTLRPLMHTDILLWIRNTFAPEKPGTRISAEGSSNDVGVKALAAFSDSVLISLACPDLALVPNALSRTFAATAEVHAEVLLVLHSSSRDDLRFVVLSAQANDTIENLRREFSQSVGDTIGERIALDSTIGVMSVVGQNMLQVAAIIGRTIDALGHQSVNIIGIAQGFSDRNVPFIVERKDLKTVLISAHREFQLGSAVGDEISAKVTGDLPVK